MMKKIAIIKNNVEKTMLNSIKFENIFAIVTGSIIIPVFNIGAGRENRTPVSALATQRVNHSTIPATDLFYSLNNFLNQIIFY